VIELATLYLVVPRTSWYGKKRGGCVDSKFDVSKRGELGTAAVPRNSAVQTAAGRRVRVV
jgi:hypothetical protein